MCKFLSSRTLQREKPYQHTAIYGEKTKCLKERKQYNSEYDHLFGDAVCHSHMSYGSYNYHYFDGKILTQFFVRKCTIDKNL